jgi:hypothetical protein
METRWYQKLQCDVQREKLGRQESIMVLDSDSDSGLAVHIQNEYKRTSSGFARATFVCD